MSLGTETWYFLNAKIDCVFFTFLKFFFGNPQQPNPNERNGEQEALQQATHHTIKAIIITRNPPPLCACVCVCVCA